MTDLNNTIEQNTPVNSDINLSQNKDDINLTQNSEQNTQENNLESNLDPNWKAFREARKRDRLEKEAAERKAKEKEAEVAALKAAMEAAFNKSAPSTQAYQQYYGINQSYDEPEETEEQRIERKVNELLEKKQRDYQKQQEEYEQREYPNRLKKDFPDFSQVCSQDNLDYLDFHYPEISRPLQRLNEGYDKWHDIYHAVKKLIPSHAQAKKDAIIADINANKPKSISSTQLSPSGEKTQESWQDIEQRRAQNWARMQRTLKGLS